ncbi:VOC family protein [Lysinibacillus macroides]|uniref:Catechol 1,2-dioxygenase n=1 Tax=Lysinibacillus macroides TaxID=33935 RepID=A0A0M9DKW4_9BACI|nr:VOC family protein [Lysinibacillus macroides]KOY83508.1 catechol 1,2-dioxygenase [Lysinibacillus macroides]QPR69380.1 VOC family protein [Lysinibacillus macroides]
MGEVLKEAIDDIAHIAHVELFTPTLQESIDFFYESLGLEIVKQTANKAYMRCWGDYEQYSIILTQADEPGVGHTAFRVKSPQALERRVIAIEEAGVQGKWIEADFGHGRAYQYHGPDGHLMELYFETEKYQAPEHLRPTLKNQPQKFLGRGAAVKNLDHINFLSSDPEKDGDFAEHVLGLRLTEQIRLDNGTRPAVWYRANSKSYELVYTKDATEAKARFHHLALSVDTNEGIWRAANLFVDQNVFIEFAPSKHAINQTYFVYVYEPGGNRIEICSGGYLVVDPDFEPITWTEQERKRGQAWGNKTIESFHTYGTPIVKEFVK